MGHNTNSSQNLPNHHDGLLPFPSLYLYTQDTRKRTLHGTDSTHRLNHSKWKLSETTGEVQIFNPFPWLFSWLLYENSITRKRCCM